MEVFLKCRGNIKEVEKELGISYPTVRNRLEGVIQALGFKPDGTMAKQQDNIRNEILDALERGELDPQDAIERLKKR